MPGYQTNKRDINYNNKRLKFNGAGWAEPQGAVVLFEDFLAAQVAASTSLETYKVVQSGTALTTALIDVTAGAPTAGHGGWLGGKTDDVAAEIDEIAFGSNVTTGTVTGWMFPARLTGAQTLIVEFGSVIPTALTARQYFAGFSDDPTEGTATDGPVNIQTAYTTTTPATDAAGWLFSSLATNPTVWKWGSVKTDVDAVVAAATEGVTGVVDCYTVNRVEIDAAGNAYFLQSIAPSSSIGRQEPVLMGANALAVNTAIGLLPIYTAAATTTTGVEWEIDYCFAATPR